MQKNGAGLHTASSCYWDNGTDGKIWDKPFLRLSCLLLKAIKNLDYTFDLFDEE